jgi:hypothetical protein
MIDANGTEGKFYLQKFVCINTYRSVKLIKDYKTNTYKKRTISYRLKKLPTVEWKFK